MSFELITKRQLDVINRKNFKYALADAEKDYFLAIVSKIIYDSGLKDRIVFKGGTAIHHCYLPQTRFSEDLDFSSLDKTITFNDVKSILEPEDFLEIKKEYVSKATIKIEKLKYSGPLGLPNSLKIEIDYMQNVVLSACEIEYENAWGIKTKVNVMDMKEICAEKIRATNDRARYRDFYDLFLLMERYKFNIEKIRQLIMQKEIRKPINQKTILKNWEIAKKEKDSESNRVYYGVNINESDMLSMINNLKFNVNKERTYVK